MTNIIKNNTKGYGYKYASLSDIANQGIEIPLMKTGTDINGKDYVFYYDEKFKDTDCGGWLRGAEIVVTNNKGMNEAQNYASGITYARRVTTQLAKQLACTDDEVVENTNADGSSKEPTPASKNQIDYIKKLYSQESINKMLEHYSLKSLSEMNAEIASTVISKATAQIEKKRQEESKERWEGLNEVNNQ